MHCTCFQALWDGRASNKIQGVCWDGQKETYRVGARRVRSSPIFETKLSLLTMRVYTFPGRCEFWEEICNTLLCRNMITICSSLLKFASKISFTDLKWSSLASKFWDCTSYPHLWYLKYMENDSTNLHCFLLLSAENFKLSSITGLQRILSLLPSIKSRRKMQGKMPSLR